MFCYYWKIIIAGTIVLVSTLVKGQVFYGINYTTENGLASNEVYDLFQDSKGYVWVATDRGVCRFDGYGFLGINTDEGLTDNTVFSVTEDRKGRVWFMLSNGTFCYFLNDSVYPYRYNSLLQSLYKGKRYPRTFFIDENENVTAGFLDMGIWRISSEGKAECVLDTSTVVKKTYFGVVENRQLSLGSVNRNNKSKLDSVRLLLQKENAEFAKIVSAGNGYNNITGLLLKDGTVLLSYTSRLFWILPDGKTGSFNFAKTISALCSDSAGNTWIGFISGGTQRIIIDGDKIRTDDSVLNNMSVTNIMRDHEGGYWFSTLEKGIYYRPGNLFTGIVMPIEKRYETTALAADGDSCVYSGTSSGLIFKSTEKRTSLFFDTEKVGEKGKVSVLYFDAIRSELWVGSFGNVFILEKNRCVTIHDVGFPKSFFTDSEGNVGFGASNNVIHTKNHKCVAVSQACTGKSLRADAANYNIEKKRLVIGSLDGLYTFNGNCLSKDSTFMHRVNCLAADKAGNLVIGSNGKGIFIETESGRKNITTDNGLTSNSINSIAIDNQEGIWVATNQGLNWITHKENNCVIRNFTIANGLLSNKINAVLTCKNKIWVATDAGTFFFDPKDYRPNNVPPPVYINTFSVNGKLRSFEKPVELSSSENHIEISFTGIGFRANGKMLYRYRIGSGEWKYTRARQLVFPSLSPGNYNFELYAQNENGIWSSASAGLAFCILQPFYKKPWVIAGSVVLFAGIIYLFFHLRFNRLKERNEIHQKLSELRQQALYAQLNPHFVFNLLNSIQSFVLTEDKDTALKHISTFARLMRLVLHTSATKLITLKQETEMLNMYLELNALRYKGRFTFEVRTENIDNPMIRIPGMLVQPYVENAIKHGVTNLDNGGMISIIFSMRENKLSCSVQDNGIGMKKSAELRMQNNPEHISAGMQLSVERLKLLCDEMKTEFFFEVDDEISEESHGTRIRFTLPFTAAAAIKDRNRSGGTPTGYLDQKSES